MRLCLSPSRFSLDPSHFSLNPLHLSLNPSRLSLNPFSLLTQPIVTFQNIDDAFTQSVVEIMFFRLFSKNCFFLVFPNTHEKTKKETFFGKQLEKHNFHNRLRKSIINVLKSDNWLSEK